MKFVSSSIQRQSRKQRRIVGSKRKGNSRSFRFRIRVKLHQMMFKVQKKSDTIINGIRAASIHLDATFVNLSCCSNIRPSATRTLEKNGEKRVRQTVKQGERYLNPTFGKLSRCPKWLYSKSCNTSTSPNEMPHPPPLLLYFEISSSKK